MILGYFFKVRDDNNSALLAQTDRQRERERCFHYVFALMCSGFLCVCVPGIWISMWNWWCGLRTTNVYVWCTDLPLSLPSCLLLFPCPLLFDSMCIERRYAHHTDIVLKTLKTWRLKFSLKCFLTTAFWKNHENRDCLSWGAAQPWWVVGKFLTNFKFLSSPPSAVHNKHWY